MSCLLRPNGSPHHTRMPRIKQTRAHKVSVNAAYDRASALRDAAWADASLALKAGEITRPEFVARISAAREEADRLVRDARGVGNGSG